MDYKTTEAQRKKANRYARNNKEKISKKSKERYKNRQKTPYKPKIEEGGRFYFRVKENDGSYGEFSGRFANPERAGEWFDKYWSDAFHLTLKLVSDGFFNRKELIALKEKK